MVDFGLSLKQVKNEETKYFEFQLEPPLEHLTAFPTEDTKLTKGLSSSTKMLLSSEVDREKIRRMEVNKLKNHDPSLMDVTNTTNKTPVKICKAMQAINRPKTKIGMFKSIL